MKRFIFFVLAMVWCVLPLMADMPKPVGHENVKIGGGFSDSVDSGIDLTHDGIIRAAEILIDVDKLFHIGGYQLTDDDAGSGDFEVQDSDNNIMLSIADGGTVGNAAITGTLSVAEDATFTGDVGIGTAPGAKLHLSSTNSHPELRLERVDASVVNNNPIGFLSFYGGEDGTETKVAAIFAHVPEDWTPTSSPVQLRFQTTSSGSTTAFTRVTIDEDGNVILTKDLEVSGDGAFNGGDLTVGSGQAGKIGTTTNPDQLQFVDATNTTIEGNVLVTAGATVAGADSSAQGILTLWDGAGGNTPGNIKIASPNGTVWYVFVEDDGTVKVHNASPTANADGSEVGSQS